LSAFTQFFEDAPASGPVGKIERHAFEQTHRLFIAENFRLVRQDVGKVHFNPTKRRRQLHPVRPRVQTCGQVDDQINSLLNLFFDQRIEEIGARRLRPIDPDERKRLGDLLAAFARQTARKRIAKHRVRPVRFSRAIDRDP
jgi:hypothetical protein